MFELIESIKLSIDKGFFVVEKFHNFLEDHGLDFIMAIIIFMVGRFVCQMIQHMLLRVMDKANYDPTARTFIGQVLYYLMLAGVILICVNQLGIPTTSFVAGFGAFGIAVGLALQNNMANFASGLLILLFKTFTAGDYIVVDGVEGTVQSIHFMNTVILTRENKTIYIPNSIITSTKIVNNTRQDFRFIDFVFDISYNNNHHQAIKVLKDVFAADKRILNPDHMEIGILEFGANSVRIRASVKIKTDNYWSVYYSVMSKVKDAFDREGIEIPYPQRVLYIREEDSKTSSTEND